MLLPDGYLPRRDAHGDSATAPPMTLDGRRPRRPPLIMEFRSRHTGRSRPLVHDRRGGAGGGRRGEGGGFRGGRAFGLGRPGRCGPSQGRP
ncbi:hypothetical protein HDA40_006341 [Hamadaea flava]|nr:hypothetical protein [Hamadaea flava]